MMMIGMMMMMMMTPADRPRVPSGISCCSFKAPGGENLLIVFAFDRDEQCEDVFGQQIVI